MGVSSVTGDGVKEFFEAVDASREEYERFVLINCMEFIYLSLRREYLPELERARQQRQKTLQGFKDDSVNRLLKDLALDRAKNPHGLLNDQWDPEEEEDDDTEINIIDRSELFLPKNELCS